MFINITSFTSLLIQLSLASHERTRQTTAQSIDPQRDYPALRIFVRWTEELRRCFTPHPNGTTHSVFRLLFPEQDVNRKYGMQEKLLGSLLAELVGIKDEELQRWNSAEASGCLGQELQRMLAIRSSAVQGDKSLSIADVDDLLNELASSCEYSHASLRLKYPSPRSRHVILRHLYSAATPADASFITQIILKDLRPLIYPIRTRGATPVLRNYTASSHQPLRIEDAMRIWDPSSRLLKAYRLTSTVDDVKEYREEKDGQGSRIRVGTFIEIPKSKKGRGCSDALSYLRRSNRVWAEIKYDGERAQIHVEILPDTEENITIFSKSKRDSTRDRSAILDIIRHAVGFNSMGSKKVKQNVVLDAEIVACQGNDIDEFWKIRRLLENKTTARIVATRSEAHEHLGLVFFDILFLDSRPLIYKPYSERRKVLESLIQTSTGSIFLAERTAIDLASNLPERELQAVFAHSISNFEEGIVLKAEESLYNDHNLPWIKLKKDYIPGYGDAVDLVLLGAAWDKKRARELHVPPTVFTTFFLGTLTNAAEVKAGTGSKPHFYLSIAVSYGMTREELEELNFIIRTSDPLGYDQLIKSPDSVDYTMALSRGISNLPAIILRQPLLAELIGAGFSKPSNNEFYELRFPRITRVYNKKERSWRDGTDFQQLQAIAYFCAGKDRSFKDVDDWCSNLWGKELSPSVRSREKRKASVAIWQEKLAMWDNKSESNQYSWSPTLAPSKRRPSVWPGGSSEESPEKSSQDLSLTFSSSEVIPSFLLDNALVWFPRSGINDKLAWKRQITPESCVHSLESLITSCGWHPTTLQRRYETTRMNGVERGLAIVHDVKWKMFVLERINKVIETYKTDSQRNSTQDRKPILVIDISEEMKVVHKLDMDTIVCSNSV